jgi:hypothetical protein
MSRLLRDILEQSAESQGDQLKEYVPGLKIFDWHELFGPRIHPIVRVEAGSANAARSGKRRQAVSQRRRLLLIG